MSVEDYNNGLIVGLSMKGLPYGVMQSWQPKSVTNANTSSITIDFDRYIPDPEVENYINALYFIYTYIEDQYTASILGWERVNLTTITFLLNDFFSCNGMITIVYNTQQGNLDALPSFVVNYVPTGVPQVIYYKPNFKALTLGIFTPKVISMEYLAGDTICALYNPVLADLGQSLDISLSPFTPAIIETYLSDASFNLILE